VIVAIAAIATTKYSRDFVTLIISLLLAVLARLPAQARPAPHGAGLLRKVV
jgi:hypothetical protein